MRAVCWKRTNLLGDLRLENTPLSKRLFMVMSIHVRDFTVMNEDYIIQFIYNIPASFAAPRSVINHKECNKVHF